MQFRRGDNRSGSALSLQAQMQNNGSYLASLSEFHHISSTVTHRALNISKTALKTSQDPIKLYYNPFDITNQMI